MTALHLYRSTGGRTALPHFCASADFAHSPATCLVVTLSRFQTLVMAIQRMVDGAVGLVWAVRGRLSRVLRFTITHD
jgi:hypothetical protein